MPSIFKYLVLFVNKSYFSKLYIYIYTLWEEIQIEYFRLYSLVVLFYFKNQTKFSENFLSNIVSKNYKIIQILFQKCFQAKLKKTFVPVSIFFFFLFIFYFKYFFLYLGGYIQKILLNIWILIIVFILFIELEKNIFSLISFKNYLI